MDPNAHDPFLTIDDLSTEEMVQQLWAIEAIKQLKARYFRAVDLKDWPLLSDCFTTPCEIDFTLATESSAGGFVAQDPRDFVAQVIGRVGPAATVHHGHMPEIRVTTADTAEGIWPMDDYVGTADDDQVQRHAGCGHYYETYERQAGQWRISSMRLIRITMDTNVSLRSAPRR